MAGQTEKSAPAKKSLGKASESGSVAVQHLLADLQAATLNGDNKAADAAKAELNKLGFE